MSEAAFYTALNADGTLTGLLTGGIYADQNLGRAGINRTNTPAAYTNGIVQPLLLVKGRAVIPDGALRDPADQTTSTRQVIELWLIDDGDAGFDTINLAADRCYEMLQMQYVGGGHVEFISQLAERDPERNHAATIRAEYEVVAVKTGA